MKSKKYSLNADIYYQDLIVISIDLGLFDTIAAIREAACQHMKTVELEYDAKIIYGIVEITNYGTIDDEWDTISTISLSIDEATGDDVIDTYTNPTKEKCQKIVNGLPNYKVFIPNGVADSQEHELERIEIDEYIEKSFYLTMTIDDEKKEIHLTNTTSAQMQV